MVSHRFYCDQSLLHLRALLKDPSQARLCYCFDLKFVVNLLVESDKTFQQFNW